MTDPRDPDPRLDELVSASLHDEAGGHHPEPDWDDVRQRSDHARRRLWQLPALAAALLVVALVAAAIIADRGDDDAGVIADEPDQTTQPDITSTTSTSMVPDSTVAPTPTTDAGGTFSDGPMADPLQLPAGAPLADDEVAAVVSAPSEDEFGRVDVVVLSTTTGEVVRPLVEGFDTVEGGVFQIVLTPDRRTVVYTLATSACTSRVEAVATDGSSDPVVVADLATTVAFSPDGGHLAIDRGDECIGAVIIDFVPVAGGPTIRYEAPPQATGTTESMVFAGPRSVNYISTSNGVPGPSYLVDFAESTARVSVADGNRRLTHLASTNGTVTALETCCDESGSGSASLITLDGLEVTDRRPVDVADIRLIAFIGFDRRGALVMTDRHALTVDGRVVAEDVIQVAL